MTPVFVVVANALHRCPGFLFFFILLLIVYIFIHSILCKEYRTWTILICKICFTRVVFLLLLALFDDREAIWWWNDERFHLYVVVRRRRLLFVDGWWCMLLIDKQWCTEKNSLTPGVKKGLKGAKKRKTFTPINPYLPLLPPTHFILKNRLCEVFWGG